MSFLANKCEQSLDHKECSNLDIQKYCMNSVFLKVVKKKEILNNLGLLSVHSVKNNLLVESLAFLDLLKRVQLIH